MKKLYQSNKWKDHSRRVAKASLEKRRRPHQRKGRIQGDSGTPPPEVSPIYSKTEIQDGRYTVKAPENFDLIMNTEENLAFFNAIFNGACKKSGDVFIDLSDVDNISAGSILYILSVLDRYRATRGAQISGNVPKNPTARSFIRDSGFYNFVKSTGVKKGEVNHSVFSIVQGTNTHGTLAKQLVDFCKGKFPDGTVCNTKSTYAAAIECMANANNHAYKNRAGHNKWWFMASQDQNNGNVQFTFLDNGRGIPATMRLDFSEKLKKVLDKYIVMDLTSDSELIFSALNGDFRTRTGLLGIRGEGLPLIYNEAQAGNLANLHILSSKGFIDCANGTRNDMRSKFYGTLLTWQVH